MDAIATAARGTVTDHQPAAPDTLLDTAPDTARLQPPAPELEQDLLVEDVSIDGMCGVY